MSEILIASIAVAALALILFGVVRVRPRFEQRAAERQADEDLDRLVSSGKVTVQGVLETATRVREEGLGGVLRDSFEQLVGSAEAEEPELRRLAGRNGILAILFSDIEDSTATNDRVGDRAWLRILTAHDTVVRGHVERHRGHIVKSQGDGFMIVFAEPEEALGCAVDIEQGMESGHRRLRRAKIRVRIGIHVGKAVAKDGDLFGRNVAFAARVAAEADGGEILVSSDVVDAAEEVEGISFGEPREVELKGLSGEHRVLAVEWA